MSGDDKKFGRFLRNNMTKPEVLLWVRLSRRQIGYLINRQYRLHGYIVDFYCRSLNAVIEVDGKIHHLKQESDERRDLHLANHGIRVLRLTAKSILSNPEFVVMRIKEFLDEVKLSRTTDDAG